MYDSVMDSVQIRLRCCWLIRKLYEDKEDRRYKILMLTYRAINRFRSGYLKKLPCPMLPRPTTEILPTNSHFCSLPSEENGWQLETGSFIQRKMDHKYPNIYFTQAYILNAILLGRVCSGTREMILGPWFT